MEVEDQAPAPEPTPVGARFIMHFRLPEPQARTQSVGSRNTDLTGVSKGCTNLAARTQSVGSRNTDPAPRRKRSITIFIIVSLLNVGLLVLLWTLLLTPAKNATQASSDPLIGQAAPNFTLAALGTHGVSNLSLTDFKGKPVMLNVWSSTCGPCIAEAPFLQSQWQHVRSQGVVFLGIDFQDTQSDGLRFLQQNSISYPNVLDATGSVSINYGVTGTPESIFINRQGVVVSRVIGPLTAQTLESNLQLITR